MKKLLLAAFAIATLSSCGGSNTNEDTTNTDTLTTEIQEELLVLPQIDADSMFTLLPTQKVFFKNLKNGDAVKSPFKVEFGVEGMEVDTAMAPLAYNKGHHHLFINKDFIESRQMVPKDSVHNHYGKAQTETELSLPAGKYKLTMQFANSLHQSYGKQMSKTINITVKK